MSSESPRAEWHAGGRVVLGAALGLGTGFSVWPYVASVFILPLGDAFGWSRGQISGAAATGLVGAALAPFAGRLVDRIGVRPVLLVSIVILAAMYFALSAMTGSLALFYSLFLVLGIAGLGTIGITYSRAVISWFSASRGLALGVSLLGVSVFALGLPPVLSSMMEGGHWQAGYRMLGGLALLVGLPAAYFLVRDRQVVMHQAPSAPWRKVLSYPVFWLLIVAILAVNIPGAGILGQLQPILVDGGMSRPAAAGMLSVYAAAIFAGRLGFGWLLDRVSPPLIAAVAFGAPAIGVGILLALPLNTVSAAAAAALLGLSAGAELDIMGFFVARYFGLRHFSTLFGAMMTALIVANAVGNILYGRAFDSSGGYGKALAWSVGGYALGVAAMLILARFEPASDLGEEQ